MLMSRSTSAVEGCTPDVGCVQRGRWICVVGTGVAVVMEWCRGVVVRAVALLDVSRGGGGGDTEWAWGHGGGAFRSP
jgi:hypothetical protein